MIDIAVAQVPPIRASAAFTGVNLKLAETPFPDAIIRLVVSKVAPLN